jgi:transposase
MKKKSVTGQPGETLYRTIRQYSKGPVAEVDMEKLLEIAADYRRVKEYVYARYGGKGSLDRLYPGYAVQNEMTAVGLRAELGLPSVYFYLAVFEALGDIRAQWTHTKARVVELAGRNGNLTEQEKHYLRFVLKSGTVFAAVLNGKTVSLPEEIQAAYEKLAEQADAENMRRYLCRQVRKYHVRQIHARQEASFAASERAYRYGDHGIYISTKEKRKRIFIPLTDNGCYKSQIRIRLFPEERSVEIQVPVETVVKGCKDIGGQVGIALGMKVMLTTDKGNCYGRELGERHICYADWIREQASRHGRDGGNNPGRKKYRAKKRRMQAGLHGYINRELNRFLTEENPGKIYMMEPLQAAVDGKNRCLNHRMALWERGYVRKRLEFKCRERGVDMMHVSGMDISVTCSQCGGRGVRRGGIFICGVCGQRSDEKANSAGNVLKRGLEADRKH